MNSSLVNEDLSNVLERDLLNRYGPLIGRDDLWGALGYPSSDAFRQAVSRKQVPITVFEIENRRGKFALTKDVAHWLANIRNQEINMK
jgi:hypothetical protein